MAEDAEKGLIYVGHIPHGFYERELREYFRQFGRVTNCRVCRSEKTGRSKGYAFVEFEHAEVAKIAAETMDNYLMFKRRLVVKFVPPEKFRNVFKGEPWSTRNYPRKLTRETELEKQNDNKGTAAKLKRKVASKLAKLKALGIKHKVKIVGSKNVKT